MRLRLNPVRSREGEGRMSSRDSLIRAVDELIEEGRLDDAVRNYLYCKLDLMPPKSPHFGPQELAAELDSYADTIEPPSPEELREARREHAAEYAQDDDVEWGA
jgi:hypothetical protein